MPDTWANRIVRAWEWENATPETDCADEVGNGDLVYTAGDWNSWTGHIGTYAAQCGASGYYIANNPGPLRFGSNSFAISYWSSITTTLNLGAVLSCSGSADRAWRVGFHNSTNYAAFHLTNTAGSWDIELLGGTWTSWGHVLAQWNKTTGLAELYVNNVLKQSNTIANIRQNSLSVHCGTDPGAWNGYYGGLNKNYLDSILVFNDALTADERSAVYNAGVGRDRAALIALDP